jgi:ATP-dependent DNA helicase PIF1
MHSALGIPATNGSFLPLTGSRLTTLQQQWEGVHFVIIDEKSMLGLKMFTKVDARLRQLVPGSLLEFGGLHIAIIGDFAQLPPVKDRALYCQPPTSENTEASKLAHDGFTLYQGFTESYQLRRIYRQLGEEEDQITFRELLGRASNGGLTRADWKFLLKRYKGNLPLDEQAKFSDSTSLHTTAEVVRTVNLDQLAALNQPCVRIQAKNEGRNAKSAESEDAGGLENDVVLARGAKVMVTRNLWQTKGHYALTSISGSRSKSLVSYRSRKWDLGYCCRYYLAS